MITAGERISSFNARAGHHGGRHLFGHNSPAAIARELIKPTADAASLIASITKQHF